MKNQDVTKFSTKNILEWLKSNPKDMSSEIVWIKSVNLRETFKKLKVGKGVCIKIKFSTESNVRSAASKYSKKNGVKLICCAPHGLDATIVIREY